MDGWKVKRMRLNDLPFWGVSLDPGETPSTLYSHVEEGRMDVGRRMDQIFHLISMISTPKRKEKAAKI